LRQAGGNVVEQANRVLHRNRKVMDHDPQVSPGKPFSPRARARHMAMAQVSALRAWRTKNKALAAFRKPCRPAQANVRL
jgi:hypothetical protein